jgi:hypothetical protein
MVLWGLLLSCRFEFSESELRRAARSMCVQERPTSGDMSWARERLSFECWRVRPLALSHGRTCTACCSASFELFSEASMG